MISDPHCANCAGTARSGQVTQHPLIHPTRLGRLPDDRVGALPKARAEGTFFQPRVGPSSEMTLSWCSTQGKQEMVSMK